MLFDCEHCFSVTAKYSLCQNVAFVHSICRSVHVWLSWSGRAQRSACCHILSAHSRAARSWESATIISALTSGWTCPGTEPVAGRSTETRSTDTKDRLETARSGDYKRSCSQGIPVTLPVVTTREGMEARWACNVALDLGASPLRKPCTLGQPCKRAGSSAGRHLCCGDLWLMILWTALIHLRIHTLAQLITTR